MKPVPELSPVHFSKYVLVPIYKFTTKNSGRNKVHVAYRRIEKQRNKYANS